MLNFVLCHNLWSNWLCWTVCASGFRKQKQGPWHIANTAGCQHRYITYFLLLHKLSGFMDLDWCVFKIICWYGKLKLHQFIWFHTPPFFNFSPPPKRSYSEWNWLVWKVSVEIVNFGQYCKIHMEPMKTKKKPFSYTLTSVSLGLMADKQMEETCLPLRKPCFPNPAVQFWRCRHSSRGFLKKRFVKVKKET